MVLELVFEEGDRNPYVEFSAYQDTVTVVPLEKESVVVNVELLELALTVVELVTVPEWPSPL